MRLRPSFPVLALVALALTASAVAVAAQTQAQVAQTQDVKTARPYAAQDPYRDQRALPDPNDPAAREALERARGEAYHRADDSRQTEEELRTTRALNDEIASRNTLADKADAAARLDHDAAVARHQIEVRQNEERARADAEATRAAQDQYDRDYAAWLERVRLCQSGVHTACATPAPR